MTTFVIASHNKKKIAELSRILTPLGFDTVCITDIDKDYPEPVEDGKSFEDNALIKARSACRFTGKPSVADDSGLCVDFLGGAPGIFSARFAGTGNDKDNIDLLLEKLRGVPPERRTAHFVSSIACVFPDGREFTVRGECYGVIDEKPSGNGGFGYDPVFVTEYGCFGTMTADEKDRISHRAKSIALFSEKIKDYIKE